MNEGAKAQGFGRYSLLRRLAVGGMGELFLAERAGFAGFSKRVVVKRIRKELVGDEEFVRMFLDEGKLAAMITHPNVVQIYELGQVEGQYFMSMEYVPGKNLAEIIEHLRGGVELRYALEIVIKLCSALTAAHEATDNEGRRLGIVHRDVSPPNILVSYSGAVKLTDFGVAKAAMREKQTRAGVVKGKFAYLSPEQAYGRGVDARADIYALGLVLFEATLGGLANPGAIEVEQIYAATQGKVLDPLEVQKDYPEDLRQIYFKATQTDPQHRFQSAEDMQHALVAFAGKYGLLASSRHLAEFMQRLFPAEALEAGEGDFLGDQTRASHMQRRRDTVEEEETVLDGPRGVKGHRFFDDPMGVPAGDEITTERDADARTREVRGAPRVRDRLLMATPIGDDDATFVAESDEDDTVAVDAAALVGRAAPVAANKPRAFEAPLSPSREEALERAVTNPRGADVVSPRRAEEKTSPRQMEEKTSPRPVAPGGPPSPGPPDQQPVLDTHRVGAPSPASGRKKQPWYLSGWAIVSLGLALLFALGVLIGVVLAGTDSASDGSAPVEEQR